MNIQVAKPAWQDLRMYLVLHTVQFYVVGPGLLGNQQFRTG